MFWLHLDDLQVSQIQPVQKSAPDLLSQTSTVLILLVSGVLPKLEPFCSPFCPTLQQVSHCVVLTPCSSLSTQHPVLIPSLHHLSPTNPACRCLLWSTVYSHTLACNIYSPSWVILTQIQPHPHQLLSHKALSQLHAHLWTSRPCLLYWASRWFII